MGFVEFSSSTKLMSPIITCKVLGKEFLNVSDVSGRLVWNETLQLLIDPELTESFWIDWTSYLSRPGVKEVKSNCDWVLTGDRDVSRKELTTSSRILMTQWNE